MSTKDLVEIGSVSAQGYIIKKAVIYLASEQKSIETPGTPVRVEIVADIAWVNRSDNHWGASNDVTLQLDMDKEEFLMQGKVIEVINRKKIFDKIMRVLVGSMIY